MIGPRVRPRRGTALRTALLVAVLAVTGLTGASCVGPAEFTSGLPEELPLHIDRRLEGEWYALRDLKSGARTAVVLLKARVEEEHLELLWYSTVVGACWGARATPRRLGDTVYLDATLVRDLKECRNYYAADDPGGHIIAIARVERARLYLRFVASRALHHFAALGHMKTRTVYTPDGSVVERFVRATLSNEEVAAFLRGVPQEALFAPWIGPFFRLDANRPVTRGNMFNLSER